MKKVLQFISFALVAGFLTFPHEVNHALATILSGERVEFILLGIGPPVAVYHLFGVPVRIGLLPVWGYIRAAG